MRYVFIKIILLFLFCGFQVHAQILEHNYSNLVKNPSFETLESNAWASNWSRTKSTKANIVGWGKCSDQWGYECAYEGSNFAVIIQNATELMYIGGEFHEQLVKNTLYTFSAQLSLGDYSPDKEGELEIILAEGKTDDKPSGATKQLYNGEITNKDGWKIISKSFEADKNYRYVFFKVRYLDLGTYYALFVDDVKIQECGYGSGKQTIGKINPVLENGVSANGLLVSIGNLANVSSIKAIKVTDSEGNTVRNIADINDLNGIKGEIFWDGTDNNGFAVEAGLYSISAIYSNDCYVVNKSLVINRVSCSSAPENIYDVAYSVVSNYKFEQARQNIALPATGKSLLLEDETITNFHAGNSIVLKNGFHANYGSDFNAVLKPDAYANSKIELTDISNATAPGVPLGFTANNADSYEVSIYNRWGNLIFDDKGVVNDDGYTQIWNGSDLEKQDVYVFYLELKNDCGDVLYYGSDVTVLKSDEIVLSESADDVITKEESIAPISISVMPNPTSGIIKIVGINEDAIVEVVELSGKMVLKQHFNNSKIEINISKFSDGEYLINILTPDNYYSERIILRR
ncbi:MAG: T9SS type A sorting domain-containing protein [Bacteroidales bacterium]|nr:T9SS type A sorting domain-containing protein [Bacteroidales bacterium]